MFHLTKNYRSHGGIVRCAQSVIELITNFWPNAIDILSREVGVVDGCKPVFFSGWDSSTVRYVRKWLETNFSHFSLFHHRSNFCLENRQSLSSNPCALLI
jgi:hypothetical protein